MPDLSIKAQRQPARLPACSRSLAQFYEANVHAD